MQFKCSVCLWQYTRSFVDFSSIKFRNLALDKDNLVVRKMKNSDKKITSNNSDMENSISEWLVHEYHL